MRVLAGPLAGRVAVVSGGGRGLGRAFCLALARQGASVVVNNRNRVVDGDGRIILVASTGGLHGDIGLSAYAASKGGLLAFGRSLAAEGAGKGALTNMLLPYALTQMTADEISDDGVRRRMTAEAVAPVLTALASPDCTLNGEYIVTGGGLLRRASPVEWETVALPGGSSLSAAQLASLVAESGRGKPREFGVSVDAFTDLAGGPG